MTPRLSNQTPDSAAHCFECLAQAGVYDDELARRLAALPQPQRSRVHGFLPQSLTDLRLYIAAISKQVLPPCSTSRPC
ncbi:MAG: hypothetical protein KF760_23405 [Candidatus Eremiobacteraeota bacterium]|nr:hypothetical protein [Candidatus Eremiobacteraeota bacterium]MCW5866172.1 hypothetical protein [Candidatus Eremiobacteraeota bacterium]